jgi:hypothetical protein
MIPIEGYKKIINVPDYFIIYEKKLVVDDELTLAKLTL